MADFHIGWQFSGGYRFDNQRAWDYHKPVIYNQEMATQEGRAVPWKCIRYAILWQRRTA